MITFESVTVTYDGAKAPVLTDVSFEIPEGELCLVIGRTGSGKSTLLRLVNGLVPHFTGGTVRGRVCVDGRDTRTHRPRDLADVVGYVGQDPLAGFVADVVEDELAYGMESLGLTPNVMRKRVEETLDLLGIAEVRSRALAGLSAGQQQRTAIGAVLCSHPRVLVLDEPTSALDPQAAEDVLASLQRLVHDLGLTVLLAEHRLERVVQYADSIIYVPGDGQPLVAGDPRQVLDRSPIAPPVVELGRLAGWAPLPLSVRDARRHAGSLRARLTDPPPRVVTTVGPRLAAVKDLVVSYRGRPALRGVTLTLQAGEVLAVMGRNGAGKSSLLNSFVGLVRPVSGQVEVAGINPATAKPEQMIRCAGLVPQQAGDLLYSETVADELTQADRDVGVGTGTCADLFASLAPGVDPRMHPRDLSEGQRLTLALAVVLVANPPLVLLDEPTRGLDYGAKLRLVTALKRLALEGHGIVLATHDVELVAEVADRVVVLGDGEVVADGLTADVVVSSPAFAPQVAKVLAPAAWLTVGSVAAALGGAS
jgi:energy-coupling factor transporter ATP-binding protein EcfA2